MAVNSILDPTATYILQPGMVEAETIRTGVDTLT
jgi:hypothetical protein